VNKRQFLGNSIKLAAAVSLPISASSPLMAQAGQYNLIEPPQSTANPEKIEVLEYFWFGCPHCFAFEPAINEWAENKPDDVDFVRHAPPLNRGWTAHSEAFYSAQALGITDKMFDELFNAIHRERNVNGKYLSTVSMAGGHKQLINLINELIEKERVEA